MNTPTSPESSHEAQPPTTRATRTRRVAFWTAVLPCLPYLALKTIWISGGQLGIPPDSELLDGEVDTAMKLLNGLTLLLDGAVIVLALVFSRDLGRRLPAWLLVGPAWVATGLLAPIVTGYPVSVVVGLIDDAPPGGEGFLEPWVFMMVYGGFLVQGVSLGVLFVGFAARRWGRIWQGRLSDLALGGCLPAFRVVAMAVVVLGAVPLSARTGRALGVVDGLSPRQMLSEGVHVPFLAAGMAAVVLLGFARTRDVGIWPVLLLTWTGSAVAVAPSLWVLATTSVRTGLPADLTPFDQLVLALSLATGLMIVTAGMVQLAIRADACWPTPAPPRRELDAGPPPRAG